MTGRRNASKSLVLCFFRRAFSICSIWNLFNDEISALQNIFSKNGYPPKLFDSLVKTFLDNIHGNNIDSPNKPEENGDRFTLVLPYFGVVSDGFKRKISSFSKMHNLHVRVVFKPFRTAHYFSLKTRCPLPLKSMVVYKSSCPHTGLSYIGKPKGTF